MDFSSVKNNPLYGPLRIVLGVWLGYAVGKNWIPPTFADPMFIASVVTIGLGVWSWWQTRHTAKKSDEALEIAVKKTVEIQAPHAVPIDIAIQQAVIAHAKVTANMTETQKTKELNNSQL